MKIFHLLDERWDSGLTAYGLALAEGQKDRGHDVSIGVKKGSYAHKAALRLGIAAHVYAPWSLKRFLARERVDVLNAHTGRGHFLGWWAKPAGAVLVRTRGDARSLKRSPGQGYLYRKTDAVTVPSLRLARDYETVFPEVKGRIYTIYPGLKTGVFSPPPVGPFRAALVGRLDPVKGQSDFLRALFSIRDHLTLEKFIITGEEKNTTFVELRRQAEGLGLGKWVEFAGRQKNIEAFMRSCHAGVIASTGSEALSRVALEWASAGRLVIATAVGCLPEIIVSGKNGYLVPSRNPLALGKCLLRLILHPEDSLQMGENAHSLARKKFGMSKMLDETLALYENLIKEKR